MTDTVAPPSRARRALGHAHRLATHVVTSRSTSMISCFVGGAALDTLAPGLSKAMDPHAMGSVVQAGLITVGAALSRRPGLPSLSTLGRVLDARAAAQTEPDLADRTLPPRPKSLKF